MRRWLDPASVTDITVGVMPFTAMSIPSETAVPAVPMGANNDRIPHRDNSPGMTTSLLQPLPKHIAVPVRAH